MTPEPTLGEIASFMTSKNAGPFLLTLDTVFRSREDYERVRDAKLLTPEAVAAAYGRDVADIVAIIYFDPAKAIKVTLRRRVPAGSPGDTDIYGAQQHVPLMSFPIPAAITNDRRSRSGGSNDR